MANQPLLGRLKKCLKLLEIEIQTIDGVQGQDLHSIIANQTRVSDIFYLGITQNFHRLNVIMPRAKMAIV